MSAHRVTGAEVQVDTSTRLRLTIIIGSTREGRVGGAIGRWIIGRARQRDDVELDIIDLADFDFPARYPTQPSPSMARLTAAIDRADAFVVVTPEYNRSFPASLKQAIDFAYDEWHAKPVGFVSYGCRSSGMYAVEHLRAVFTELHAVTIRNGVSFNLLDGSVGEAGEPLDADGSAHAAATMLDQLIWWGDALRDARAKRPYVC